MEAVDRRTPIAALAASAPQVRLEEACNERKASRDAVLALPLVGHGGDVEAIGLDALPVIDVVVHAEQRREKNVCAH